jgi:hypothetical protein
MFAAGKSVAIAHSGLSVSPGVDRPSAKNERNHPKVFQLRS